MFNKQIEDQVTMEKSNKFSVDVIIPMEAYSGESMSKESFSQRFVEACRINDLIHTKSDFSSMVLDEIKSVLSENNLSDKTDDFTHCVKTIIDIGNKFTIIRNFYSELTDSRKRLITIIKDEVSKTANFIVQIDEKDFKLGVVNY